MTLYPDVQRKAQAEIDRVVGNLRSPDYSDQDELPYVQAVLKEVEYLVCFNINDEDGRAGDVSIPYARSTCTLVPPY